MLIKHYHLIDFNERPNGAKITAIVIHSMYAKHSPEKTAAIPCFELLKENKVSAHYSIDRHGFVWSHVDPQKRAWHAGESSLPSVGGLEARPNVNDFSIGIEMIGVYGQRFRGRQYKSLLRLIYSLLDQYPIEVIVSHQTIAPTRKHDPGPSFRWDKLRRGLDARKGNIRIIP